MATKEQVKQYLAYWFQLGKQVSVNNDRRTVLPKPVISDSRYSEQFEELWQYLLSPESGDCYLEGTEQTIGELLTSDWTLNACARCEMPVPVRDIGRQSLSCPCIDLPLWPNEELPKPRSPVDSKTYLSRLQNLLSNPGS